MLRQIIGAFFIVAALWGFSGKGDVDKGNLYFSLYLDTPKPLWGFQFDVWFDPQIVNFDNFTLSRELKEQNFQIKLQPKEEGHIFVLAYVMSNEVNSVKDVGVLHFNILQELRSYDIVLKNIIIAFKNSESLRLERLELLADGKIPQESQEDEEISGAAEFQESVGNDEERNEIFRLLLQKGTYRVNGMFVNFGSDAYDWLYMPMIFEERDGRFYVKYIYKLDGMDVWGEFLWTSLDSTVFSMDDYYMLYDPNSLEVHIGDFLIAKKDQGRVYEILSKKNTLDINGFFFKFGPDKFDWIYFIAEKKPLPGFESTTKIEVFALYKLEGMDRKTGGLMWQKVSIPRDYIAVYDTATNTIEFLNRDVNKVIEIIDRL